MKATLLPPPTVTTRRTHSSSLSLPLYLSNTTTSRRPLRISVSSLVFLFFHLLLSLQPSTATSGSTNTNTNTNTNTKNNHIMPSPAKEKVCIVGSGNWASAISVIIGTNCQKQPFCHTKVNMYVYDEIVKFQNKEDKLSTIINTYHENPKYLPNISLPDNVIAVPNLIDAIKDATLLIFCLPHQFLPPILSTIRNNYHLLNNHGSGDGSGSGCRGVSLIKGMDYDSENKSPILISKSIQDTLQHNFSCGVLMGANVANGVAQQQICESTLATNYHYNPILNERTKCIFNTNTFRIYHTKDIYGTEACGALKNIIALGCGFIDSLYDKDKINEGSNTKAALIRIGLLEMKRFCYMFLDDVVDDTFWQSCGIADLITTCYSGRNYRCAKEFGYSQRQEEGTAPSTTTIVWDEAKCEKEWSKIESSLLNGQKLQGTLTCQEVYMILSSRNLLQYFPLIKVIYEIAFQGKRIECIVDGIIVVDYDGDDNNNNNNNDRNTIHSSMHTPRSKL